MFPENPKGLLFTAKYGRVCGRFVTRVKKKRQTNKQIRINLPTPSLEVPKHH